MSLQKRLISHPMLMLHPDINIRSDYFNLTSIVGNNHEKKKTHPILVMIISFHSYPHSQRCTFIRYF